MTGSGSTFLIPGSGLEVVLEVRVRVAAAAGGPQRTSFAKP
jgi:hypothetical protein